MQNGIGSWLIILGAILIVIGLLAKTGLLGWFGNLPGDLHIKRDGFQFYFPLGSMIVVSLLASIIRRLL